MRKRKTTAAKNQGSWKPSGELTIYTAAESKTNLVNLLREFDDIDIDLSQIETLDCAGIQILLMAKREADACNKQLKLSQLSDSARDSIRVLNLSQALDIQP